MIVNVTFNDRDVIEGFKNMDARAKRLGQGFRRLVGPLRDDLRQHADAQESPATKQKWPRRAAQTEGRASKRARTISVSREKRRTARGEGKRRVRVSGPLRESHVRRPEPLGSLPETVDMRSNSAGIVASSAVVKWSAVHNDGGPAGNGAVIPQREFLAFSPEFLDGAAEFLIGMVAGGFE